MQSSLSPEQQALWFSNLSAPQACQCAELVVLPPSRRSDGTWVGADIDILAQAITYCSDQIPEFQARFYSEHGEPRVEYGAESPEIDFIDEDELRNQMNIEDLASWAHTLLDKAPDTSTEISGAGLAQHFLGQQKLFDEPATVVWVLRVHHIVADGFALNTFIGWVARCYSAIADHTALPDNPFACPTEQPNTKPDALDSALKFWKEQPLEANPPALFNAGANGSSSLSARTHISSSVRQQLRELATQAGATELDIACVLLAHYTASMTYAKAITLGLPMMNRPFGAPKVAFAPRATVMPLALHCSFAPTSLEQNLTDAARVIADARKHSSVRLEDIRRLHGLSDPSQRITGPSLNFRPFSDVFNFGEHLAQIRTLSAGPIAESEWILQSTQDGGWDCLLLTRGSKDDADRVRAHVERVAAFFEQAAALSLSAPLGSISIAQPDEIDLTIQQFNQTDRPLGYEPNATLCDLARRNRKRALECAHEDSPTLFFYNGEELSASEAWGIMTRIAHKMYSKGVRAGDMLALGLPRSPALSLSIGAALLIGASWVPIDPELPIARQKFMLERTEPQLMVVRASAMGSPRMDGVGGGVEKLVLETDDLRLGLTPLPDDPPWLEQELPISPEDMAYVLFTSGSTGTPKAVAVPHRGVLNRLAWMVDYYAMYREAGARIIQKTPSSFDVSIWEFLLPLIHDVPCAILPETLHHDPSAIAAHLHQAGVTHCHFVPSALSAFLAQVKTNAIEIPTLQHLITSGESLSADLAHAAIDLLGVQVHNLYGPTEATIDVTAHTVEPGESTIPIGKPVWNTKTYVLDPWQQPLPPGAQGVLYLSGVQVAKGYLGQPELSAKLFIADPFNAEQQTDDSTPRMYCTGDLASWREDGALLYLGRNDGQVKLRGQRLELDEVTTLVQRINGVAEATTVIQDSKLLVTYIVRDANEHRDPSELATVVRAACTEALPAYMVPNFVLEVTSFPLTVNGKLDRNALPRPAIRQAEGTRLSDDAHVARVQQAFSQILGLPTVAVQANFFDLGGTSLEAIQLANFLGGSIRVAHVFAAPTVEGLANLIRSTAGAASLSEGATAPWLELRAHQSGVPVVCLYPAGGLGWSYAGLVSHLDSPRGVYACQAPGIQHLDQMPKTLCDAATRAAKDIRAMCQRTGVEDIDLVGWSVGGVLAQEIAHRSEEFGLKCRRVVLLDAYPAEGWARLDPPSLIEQLQGIATMAGLDHIALPAGQPERAQQILQAELQQSRGPFAHLPEEFLSIVTEVVQHNASLMREHRTGFYAGTMHMVQAAGDPAPGAQLAPASVRDPKRWTKHCAQLCIHPLDATHPEMVHPRTLAVIARLLDDSGLDCS
ncbi:non-ribosomal peptide synthetase [Corynebacterium gerontici]|uniref:Enterobactin synthase component F n=1 Tax=Corynebacterium gerontici TaxID=2079234 RepID=A0A3G6J2E2_9CORY|nr:non-ribosomal peptide synthetase [Corynebacterium gerontici]AZA12119.1 Enterobactin synthase component F [Corynebacterium gerontici]